jgi:excinuclease ABC subunit C
MDESKEKMLSYGIYDLRKKLNSYTKKIIVPFIPESNEENIQIHVAIRGEKKKLLDLAYQNVVQDKLNKIKQETKKELTQREVLYQLKDLLQLENVPDFIDAFDNSNINGAYAVAGCVVFKNGLPSKRDYKHFQIKTVEGMDDYSSMKEVVRRRYNNLLQNKEQLPNLIVADGGIGHMNAISQIVQQEKNLNIPIVGLKKNKKHKTNKLIFGDPPMEIDIKTNSELFHLLERIQDEVHRFAITYHKNLRSKGLTHSQLDDIQNIGPKTKLKLLNQFKTYNNIKNASIEQLQETIGKNRASIVYKYFRQK